MCIKYTYKHIRKPNGKPKTIFCIVEKGYGCRKIQKNKDKIRDVKKPYIVSAFFPYKYSHTCYDGSTSYNPTNEVIRSSEKELERVVEQFKTENAEKIRVGIELKVLGGTLL